MILGQLRMGARQAKNAPLNNATSLVYNSFQSQETQIHCRQVHFWCLFLDEKSFPGQTANFRLLHVIHILKVKHGWSIKEIGKSFWAPCDASEFCKHSSATQLYPRADTLFYEEGKKQYHFSKSVPM